MNNETNLPAKGNTKTPSTLQNTQSILMGRSLALSQTQYCKRVTRDEPAGFMVLIDQSKSMGEFITDNSGNQKTKAEHLSIIVNTFLEELILTCQKTTEVKDYFEILVLGYGKKEDPISIVWDGPLKDKEWVTVTELKNGSLRKEIITKPNPKPIGKREISEELNVWIEPFSEGLTPMKTAFLKAKEYLVDWTLRNPESFPPLVFNITDGNATDIRSYDELLDAADELKSVSTTDGNTLLFNLFLNNHTGNLDEFPFLSQEGQYIERPYMKALFQASSTIPNALRDSIRKPMDNKNEEIKGVVFGNINSVIKFLNIGTLTIGNRLS